MALMYNARSRRNSDDGAIFAHALRHNPILSAAAGTVLVAGGCRTLGNSVVMCIIMTVLLPLLGYLSAIERERISSQKRMAAYCAGATAVIFVLSLIIDNIVLGCVEAVGIFVPLMAVSPLVLARTAPDAPILTRREAVIEGLTRSLVFALIAIPVGFIRELFGHGTLFGMWLGFAGNDIFDRPFIGFILCGLAVALIRRLTATPERSSGKEAAK